MGNVALGKKVEEEWKNASEVTNGIINGYTAGTGFVHTNWPDYLTIDLESICKLYVIRFLLWDRLGNSNKRDKRKYKYRLLTSEDHNEWQVHFDTGKDGFNGWQEFEFNPPVSARYVRIHAMWNSANVEYHIVEVEAHDSPATSLIAECVLKRVINNSIDKNEIEVGEPFPLTSKVFSDLNKIEELVNDNDYIKPEKFLRIINDLRVKFRDMTLIEQSMDSIRREIIRPVTEEMEEASKLGKYSKYGFIVGLIGFIVGLVGGIMTIITLIVDLNS